MCPNKRLGTVDVLLGLHHGQASSNSAVLVSTRFIPVLPS